MKKKSVIFLCILGISFLYMGMRLGFHHEPLENPVFEGAVEELEPAFEAPDRQPEQTPIIQVEQTPIIQKEEMNPEEVLFERAVAKLNGCEGKISYRWGYDSIVIDDETVLISCDYYFADEKLQQKIFYLAKAPNFVSQEVFRQNSRKESDDTSQKSPDTLERRMICPLAVQDGYAYELDGALYCLSEDFHETTFICDLRELMGGLYEFSPWIAEQHICDVTGDVSRMLACTDEGLYEYDLKHGEKKLLEPALFEPYEIVHVEGDCDCGETGFEFSGPIEAEYGPDDQSYAFLAGTEYGDPESVTLRSADGETLYQKELEGYMGNFEWMEAEDTVYLAVFYREEAGTWMDRVDIHTGEKTTFAVPDAVFCRGSLIFGFPDGDSLIYYQKKTKDEEGKYKIYQLYGGEQQGMEIPQGEVKWRLIALKGLDYQFIVKYPEPSISFG